VRAWRKDRLATEITLVLGIKVLLLWLLWLAFFQHPLDEQLTNDQVRRAMFDAAPEIAATGKEIERW
jgi:hypothetical protein